MPIRPFAVGIDKVRSSGNDPSQWGIDTILRQIAADMSLIRAAVTFDTQMQAINLTQTFTGATNDQFIQARQLTPYNAIIANIQGINGVNMFFNGVGGYTPDFTFQPSDTPTRLMLPLRFDSNILFLPQNANDVIIGNIYICLMRN